MIRTTAKFAGFVVVCLAMTLWLAFTIGNIELFDDRYTLTATFDDVTGLLINDNVKVAGVVVGKVTGIQVEEGRARIEFNVKEDVRVPEDSRAAIRWRNLLGQRYLYLYPGTASTTLEDGDDVDETVSVIDLGELFNRLGPIVAAIDPEQVNTFLDAIVEALDGNQTKVRQVLDDLAVLSKGLGQRDVAIGRLVENLNTVAGTINSRDAQIRTMLDNLVLISETFSANTDVLDSAVTELGDFSTDFGFLLENNRAEIDRIVTNLAELVALVETKLATVDHALGGLDEAATGIFNSSRHGEWLNQVIPCSGDGPPPPGEPCAKDASGDPPEGSSSSAPAPSIARLMGVSE